MIQNLGPFPGEWCDCDWSPADEAFVFAFIAQPGLVHLVESGDFGTHSRGFLNLGRWGLYLRAAADGHGNVCCVLQDGRDRNPATGQYYPAIVVLFPRDGSPREIACPAGPAFGQNAVEVRRSDSSGWTVYVATSPTSYWFGWLDADGRWLAQQSAPWPATSQGFADGPERMDDARDDYPGMVCPSTADGLSIGQAGEPDRIRGLHNGTYFTVLAGAGFEPHLASDGQGRWMAAARTPQGAALVALAAPFEPEPRPPDPPVGLPDVPWAPDPTRTVDMLEFHKAAATAYIDNGDGTGQLWMHKSQERDNWGENRDHDAHWIGFVEDRSTGTRMITLPEPRPKKHSFTNTTRDRWSPEAIVKWNTDHPDRPVGDYCTLPLAGYTWVGNRPFMHRHVTGRAELIFRAAYDWWDDPAVTPVVPGSNPPRGRWELHPPIRIHIAVQTGYARFNGHDVYAMSRYGRPLDEMGPHDEVEWSLWGPHGWIGFIVFDRDGRENVGARRIAPPEQRASPLNGVFVPARFPTTYPIYTPPAPEPEKEPDVNPTVNQIPRDQIVMAARAIDEYLLANPRLGLPEGLLPDVMEGMTVDIGQALDATCAYLIGEWCPKVCALGPFPGDAAGWTQRREAGLHHVFHVIERERGEQPPPVQPPSGTLRGPISVSGRDFEVPQS